MSSKSNFSTDEPFFPLPGSHLFCKVIPGFLSPQECRSLIAESEARGFACAESDYPPSYRNNDRQVLDSPELASRMLSRLRGLVPQEMKPVAVASLASPWALDSINERFRFCRYLPGQHFEIHQDGVHHRSRSQQSCLTFLVYLSDAAECEGGDTFFYEGGPASNTQPIAKVTPRAGSLIVFDHRLWHAGARVTSGVKYILRSDVLYRAADEPSRVTPQAFEPGHQGYVWTLEALDEETFASGGRDTAIHVWRRDGSLIRAMHGHTRSVLGLASLPDDCVASVSRDRSLRLWDWRSGTCQHVVEHAHTAAVLGVVAIEGSMLATSGADRLVKLWDSKARLHANLEGHQSWVWAVDKMPGGLLASASEDGDVRIWDVRSGACLHVLPGAVALRSLAVSGCGRCIATANMEGGLAIWELLDGTWVRQQEVRAHDAAVRRVRWLSGKQLASAGEDNQTRLWTMPDCRQIYTESSQNFTTDIMAMGDEILSCSYDGQIRWLGEQVTSSGQMNGHNKKRSHQMIDLEANWIETCKNIGFDEPDIDLFRALCKRYSEPQRRYHTLQHLSECLALAEQDRALAQHPAEVAYALWFHDAVYELDRHDNEQESTNWARATLTAAGVQADVADRVSALIMATRHSGRPTSPDAQLVVDIDLAILAAAPDRFEEYERQIRFEYQHVPEQIFLTKRLAVLSSFLERPQIYLTPTYAQRFESAARHNLKSRI